MRFSCMIHELFLIWNITVVSEHDLWRDPAIRRRDGQKPESFSMLKEKGRQAHKASSKIYAELSRRVEETEIGDGISKGG